MRTDRTDGIDDIFCNSIMPNVSTYCTILIRDQKQYIFFPQKRICC